MLRSPFLLLIAMAALLLAGASIWRAWPAQERLEHAQPGMEELARQLLLALQHRDMPRLQQLALSRAEFARFVWPELPASRPGTNLSLDYVWSDVALRSAGHLQRLTAQWAGKSLRLVRVEHRGQVVRYSSHNAFPDMHIMVQENGGPAQELPLFGTLIEMDGKFKVYSYAPYD